MQNILQHRQGAEIQQQDTPPCNTEQKNISLLPTQAVRPGEVLSEAVWGDGWSWSKGQTGLGHPKLQAGMTACQGSSTCLPEGWGAP